MKKQPIAPEPEPEKVITGVKVLMIDGKSYPVVQFWSANTKKCDDHGVKVWRTDTGKAVDVDGQSIDERTDGCRFGLTEEIEADGVEMTQAQIDKFEELTGLKITEE